MLKLILSCVVMLFMTTPSFPAPAYVPVKENVVDSFFQMSHYKKMVLDLCNKADITDATIIGTFLNSAGEEVQVVYNEGSKDAEFDL